MYERNQTYTHSECRPKICLVCHKKNSIRNANEKVYQAIADFRPDVELDASDVSTPSGICDNHRKIITTKSNDQEQNIKNLEFKPHDHVIISDPESRNCTCFICTIVKGTGSSLRRSKSPASSNEVTDLVLPVTELASNSINIEGVNVIAQGPSTSILIQPSPSSIHTVQEGQKEDKCESCGHNNKKRCIDCLSKFGPGYKHSCFPVTKKTNMINMALENPKIGQAVAVAVIKSTPPSPGGTIRLQGANGPPLPISIGVAKEVEPILYSVDDLVELRKIVPGMSNASLKRVCTWLNSKQRGSVEDHFQQKLLDLDKLFLEYFEVKEFDFKLKSGELEKLPIAICKNMHNFIERVIELRELNPDRLLLKFLVDKGSV